MEWFFRNLASDSDWRSELRSWRNVLVTFLVGEKTRTLSVKQRSVMCSISRIKQSAEGRGRSAGILATWLLAGLSNNLTSRKGSFLGSDWRKVSRGTLSSLTSPDLLTSASDTAVELVVNHLEYYFIQKNILKRNSPARRGEINKTRKDLFPKMKC